MIADRPFLWRSAKHLDEDAAGDDKADRNRERPEPAGERLVLILAAEESVDEKSNER